MTRVSLYDACLTRLTRQSHAAVDRMTLKGYVEFRRLHELRRYRRLFGGLIHSDDPVAGLHSKVRILLVECCCESTLFNGFHLQDSKLYQMLE